MTVYSNNTKPSIILIALNVNSNKINIKFVYDMNYYLTFYKNL